LSPNCVLSILGACPEDCPNANGAASPTEAAFRNVLRVETNMVIAFTVYSRDAPKTSPHPEGLSSAELPRGTVASLTHKRVDDAYAGIYEIGTVPRGDRELMNGRGRCDEAIFDRHRFPGGPKPRQQFRPFQTCVRIPS